jgi:hypothetical protein|tara:strand:+ start:269 stop:547 length:279 start_codon:yes stop_codon:yes gene_type:complete
VKEMIWTILGQDRVSGKLESFVLFRDGPSSKEGAFSEASETVEVLAIIQGNQTGAMTLYSPFSDEIGLLVRTEKQRIEAELFKRCSEYWEGI